MGYWSGFDGEHDPPFEISEGSYLVHKECKRMFWFEWKVNVEGRELSSNGVYIGTYIQDLVFGSTARR